MSARPTPPSLLATGAAHDWPTRRQILSSPRQTVAKWPIVGPALVFGHRFGYRFKTAMSYYWSPLRRIAIWLFTSRESGNYTYDLDETNTKYLGAFVADIIGRPTSEIAGYIRELENDPDLPRHIRDITALTRNDLGSDSSARYGRRLGWYAFVRAVKPKIVVETGVDKGLGSCVLASALARNAAEGHAGYYYGTEINPAAGYLLTGKYAEFGEILYGDSIATLTSFGRTIDLMINDSDHSAEYEAREYQVVDRWLARDALVLGDNSHCTDKLFLFAQATGREFLYFGEKPRNHWYPGGGIGVAFRRNRAAR